MIMAKRKQNPKVDWYFNKPNKWQKELKKLRAIALDCGLTEELKWGQPCYTSEKRNIVLIHDFKDYCAYLFFKGALMKDTKNLLIQQTPNVQSPRQIRFTNAKEITDLAPILKEYVREAEEVEGSGAKVKLKETSEYSIPEEFQSKLDTMPRLKKSFEALTPGRQRGYLFYFSSAKQSKTRAERVEKYMKQILGGKGMDD
jgi:uncharacterized protein YdeI (YjbR/CyaY-like superfamily)